jgi:hypothetical protein
MTTTRKLIIGYKDYTNNTHNSYDIPEYVKLVIGDTNGIEYEPRNWIYLAINITTGETTSFHKRDGKTLAENFISGRENEFHLLECRIEEYLAGHDKIESHIIHKYIGTEFWVPDRNCNVAEITTDINISIGNTIFVCPYSSEYRTEYWKKTQFRNRLPIFSVAKEKDKFTTLPDKYDLRCLAELVVN